MKSILAVHDLSCHGSGSLNIALPVLMAGGLDVSVLPSAVLSTQSDGFSPLFVKDLETECMAILDAWKEFGFRFDALYTGYLADTGQLDIIERVRRDFLKEDALIITDPVMGDDGTLYQNLGLSHVDMMRRLARSSSVITPNATEACLLTHRECRAEWKKAEAEDLAAELCSLSGSSAVITSLVLEGGFSVNLASDGRDCRCFSYDMVDASYPGSGDLFASLLSVFLLGGDSFFVSVLKATRLTSHAIERTYSERRERREGVIAWYALRALGSEAGVPPRA